MTAASEMARLLAERIDRLAAELLPGGYREGTQWRAGSVAGERGESLAVALTGRERGKWIDHANPDHRGDALDLVRACLECSTPKAIAWAEGWLGIDPDRGNSTVATNSGRRFTVEQRSETQPNWPRVWRSARPIAGTIAEQYLENRGLAFDDRHGDALRFHPSRARLRPGSDRELEHHPALLALVCDVRTGEPCGLHSIFLRSDGTDRLRDKKGKLSAGRISGGAVMLDSFEDIAYGLTLAEGIETAIAVYMAELRPVWVCCGASNLAAFPVLPVIQSLTVAADTGAAGQAAAREVAARWHTAGREVRIATPRIDDWAASWGTAQ